jgi:hypothetical protein
MPKVERRKPTRAEWQQITSRRPVVRRIAPPGHRKKSPRERSSMNRRNGNPALLRAEMLAATYKHIMQAAESADLEVVRGPCARFRTPSKGGACPLCKQVYPHVSSAWSRQSALSRSAYIHAAAQLAVHVLRLATALGGALRGLRSLWMSVIQDRASRLPRTLISRHLGE